MSMDLVAKCRFRLMTARRVIALLTAAIMATIGQSAVAVAQEDNFLRGQIVRMFVGSGQGGGFDLYARMIAPHFEKATGATMVIENRPGGNNLNALNQLVKEPADGLTMMLLQGESAILGKITDQPGLSFDLETMTILARVSDGRKDPRAVIVESKSEFNSIADMIASKETLTFGAQGRLDGIGDYAATLCEATQLNCKIVTGYNGSGEVVAAVMGGELAGQVQMGSGSKANVESGRVKVIANLSRERGAIYPDVPTVFEQVKLTKEGEWWFDFRNSISEFSRVIVAPPNLPTDRLAYLQKVWQQVLTSPELEAEALKAQRPLSYGNAEDMRKVIQTLMTSLTPEKLEEVKRVFLEKY